MEEDNVLQLINSIKKNIEIRKMRNKYWFKKILTKIEKKNYKQFKNHNELMVNWEEGNVNKIVI